MTCHYVKTGTGNEGKLWYARTHQLHNIATLLSRKRAPRNQCIKGTSLRGTSSDTSNSCTPLSSNIQDPTYDFPSPVADPTCYCLSTVLELIYNPHSSAQDPAYDCLLTILNPTCDLSSTLSNPTYNLMSIQCITFYL